MQPLTCSEALMQSNTNKYSQSYHNTSSSGSKDCRGTEGRNYLCAPKMKERIWVVSKEVVEKKDLSFISFTTAVLNSCMEGLCTKIEVISGNALHAHCLLIGLVGHRLT